MSIAERRPLELLYEGSVKRVWQAPDKQDCLWFEFTDDYSVFDWGKMPDTIGNKGRALALMGGYLFDRLAKQSFWQTLPESPHLVKFDRDWLQARFKHPIYSGPDGLSSKGAPTHFSGLTHRSGRVSDLAAAAASSEPLYMEVLKADVRRPQPFRTLHHNLFLYPRLNASDLTGRRFVPLEIVFRFGMPGGSSLVKRIERDPDYALDLGIKPPTPGQLFEHPVLEFYTKLEPKDRLLSWQEAILMSGLNDVEFESLVELALDTAIGLHVLFAERQMELWDGKLEMCVDGSTLMLADSIGPDELRLLYRGCHLSKEMIRQIYRGTPWERALHKAQQMAKEDPSRSWKDIAIKSLKVAPDPLSPEIKKLVDMLYGVITNTLVGDPVFKELPPLDDYISSLPASLVGENVSRRVMEGV